MADPSSADSPWHSGELIWQSRVGSRQTMAATGRRLIRSFMPEQHRLFFTALPMLVIASEDHAGNIWASPLFGRPGFAQSPTPHLLTISLGYDVSRTMAQPVATGDVVGILGIDFQSRRRNRVNGRVTERTDSEFSLGVDQSFGNCPRYVTPRIPVENPGYRDSPCREFTSWDDELRRCISRADTCFIASTSRGLSDSTGHGADVSHRGGQPGFVGMDREQRLLIPDFPGNRFFNTLGNLEVYPRAGLLFIDFENGDILQLTTLAEVVDQSDAVAEPTSCRFVRLTLVKGRIWQSGSPLLWNTL